MALFPTNNKAFNEKLKKNSAGVTEKQLKQATGSSQTGLDRPHVGTVNDDIIRLAKDVARIEKEVIAKLEKRLKIAEAQAVKSYAEMIKMIGIINALERRVEELEKNGKNTGTKD